MKKINAIALAIAILSWLILSGCSVNPKDDVFSATPTDRYQLIPAPLEIDIPNLDEEPAAKRVKNRGALICLR